MSPDPTSLPNVNQATFIKEETMWEKEKALALTNILSERLGERVHIVVGDLVIEGRIESVSKEGVLSLSETVHKNRDGVVSGGVPEKRNSLIFLGNIDTINF